MKIMITGDMGFVGNATKKSLANDHQVIGYDAMRGQDIRDLDQFSEFVRQNRPDRILHLAAIARFADADADPLLAHETNVLGTKNVSLVASDFRIPLVYASTGSVNMPIKAKPPITEEFPAVGNSVYGCTKAMGELLIRKSQAPWIILRYSHLYGKDKRMHGLIGGFLDRINRGLAPVLMGGKQSNDFCYIEDIAMANVLALNADWDKWRHVYCIGTGEELSAEDAGKIICETFGYKGDIDVRERREVDPDRFFFDCSKSERMLGFKSKYSFREGLAHMKSLMDEKEQERFLRVA
jgi:UDP-glucose 4-epimerase